MLYDIDYPSQHYYGLNFQPLSDLENTASVMEATIAIFIEHKQEIEEA